MFLGPEKVVGGTRLSRLSVNARLVEGDWQLQLLLVELLEDEVNCHLPSLCQYGQYSCLR